MLGLEERESRRLLRGDELPLGFLDDVDGLGGVGIAEWLLLPTRAESLGGVLPDRLEHGEARLAGGVVSLVDETLGDERCQPLQGIIDARADGLHRLQRTSAGEYRHLLEEPALPFVQQFIAP